MIDKSWQKSCLELLFFFSEPGRIRQFRLVIHRNRFLPAEEGD